MLGRSGHELTAPQQFTLFQDQELSHSAALFVQSRFTKCLYTEHFERSKTLYVQLQPLCLLVSIECCWIINNKRDITIQRNAAVSTMHRLLTPEGLLVYVKPRHIVNSCHCIWHFRKFMLCHYITVRDHDRASSSSYEKVSRWKKTIP